MKFQGGKYRHRAAIAKLILEQGRDRYMEPFVGGANVLMEVAPHMPAQAGDSHADLVLMWSAVADGWKPPSTVSEDEYRALKCAAPSPLRGFAGYAQSWAGKWFGGYARGDGRNYADEARRAVLRQAPLIATAEFRNVGYEQWRPEADCVVYCDPPYQDTTNLAQCVSFDHSQFWQTMGQWTDQGAAVLVSERQAPAGWEPVLPLSSVRNLGLNIDKYSVPEAVWMMA